MRKLYTYEQKTLNFLSNSMVMWDVSVIESVIIQIELSALD
jgi:hypothetical protein